MNLKIYQLNSCDEAFYIIATDIKHAKNLHAEIEPTYAENAEDVFDYSIKEVSLTEASEIKIIAEEMESEGQTLLNYYNEYVGEGTLVGSTLYLD